MPTAAPQLFSKHKDEWLNFYIVLKDAKQAAQLQADHPNGVAMSPIDAGIAYNCFFVGYSEAAPVPPSPWVSQIIWTPWWTDNKGHVFPTDQKEFDIHSGGFWGIGGTTTHYRWLGTFQTAADPNRTGTGGTEGPIGRRRWIDGFELASMTSVPGGVGLSVSRDASRHVGGLGLAFRGGAATFAKALNLYGTPSSFAHASWERFYLRLRRAPTSTTPIIWRCNGSPSAGAGAALGVNPAGQLVLYASDSLGNYTLIAAVFTLDVWHPVTNPNAWHKVDLLLKYINPTGTASLFIDGFPVREMTGNGMGGTAHQSSQFGSSTNPANDLEIDIDDWMNSEIPGMVTAIDPGLFTGKDCVNGSKIVAIRPKGFASSHNAAAWPGDFRVVLQQPFNNSTPMQALASTSSGSLLAVTTDDADVVDADKGSLGQAAVVVALMGNRNASPLSGQLGLTANGVTTMVNITEFNTPQSQAMLKTASGGSTALEDFTPIELRRTKSSDGLNSFTYALGGMVELIGRWGKEDLPGWGNTDEEQAAHDAITFPIPVGQHNAPYPHSPWALGGNAAPIAPFIVKLGTYVGNNTGQDLSFRAPVNWLWIRRVSGGSGTYQWWSTMLGSHQNLQEAIKPQMAQGLEDLSFAGSDTEGQQQQYLLRLAGNDASMNAVGVTYQYIAVCDPGQRFMLNATVSHQTGEPAADYRLVSDGFTPRFTMLFTEGANSTTTPRLYGKGPGSVIDGVTGFSTPAFTNAYAIGTGVITTLPTLHGVGEPIALNFWRQADGNNDPAQAGALQIGTWTGDGSATRTIGLTPTGLRPTFVIVFADNGNGFWRDPSHTGTNSANSAGVDTPNGITAGAVDSFTVGSTLNSNGVIYNYLVFFGSATACNNGWGCNGEYSPVEPVSPTDGPWPDPPDPEDPTLPPGGAPPGPGPDPNPPGDPNYPIDPDTPLPGTPKFCVDFSGEIVNQALSRIGISKQVVDLGTDMTIEAIHARLHITTDIETTLRDYPWPFATTYARLTLVAGSVANPVNADWTFSYRRPWDCIFERRLVLTRGEATDPTPPPFAIGGDSGGGLIYCNVANALLEYTGRKQCPTYEGDVLFKEALIWRHAASLAPALTRIDGKVAACVQAYELAIEKARHILTPGKPGSVLPVVAIDTTAAQIAANVAVVNRGLVRLGARTISSFAEQSREAVAVNSIFEEELRAVLRDFSWPFATAYASPLTLVAGTAAVAVNNDWQYSYRLPADCVFARRLVSAAKRSYEPQPPMFKTATDATGGLLYTNEVNAVLEYTARVPGTVALSDTLFRDALAWRIAALLAPSLAYVDPLQFEQRGRGPDDPHDKAQRQSDRATQIRQRIADDAWQHYRYAIGKAAVPAANEQQPDLKQPDAPWITDRN
jgi:hypothetical protein